MNKKTQINGLSVNSLAKGRRDVYSRNCSDHGSYYTYLIYPCKCYQSHGFTVRTLKESYGIGLIRDMPNLEEMDRSPQIPIFRIPQTHLKGNKGFKTLKYRLLGFLHPKLN